MNIAVYCGSLSGNDRAFTESARVLGKWIGANGHRLVYGGATSGLMGVVADAVLAEGGEVIGVIPGDIELILKRVHRGLTELITTKDMADRRSKMIELSDAYVALPGGPGTIDEISEVISLSRLGVDKKPIVLFNTNGYYDGLKAFYDNMIRNKFVDSLELNRVLYSSDPEEIAEFISAAGKR